MNGDALDFGSNFDWLSTGASAPPPSSQPSFNSPVTTDSFGILDTISTGVDSIGSSINSILGTVSSVQSATANNRTQAAQLVTQSQNTTQIQRAQSTAQIQQAQANANIASAFAQFTAHPLLLAIAAFFLYLLIKKLA